MTNEQKKAMSVRMKRWHKDKKLGKAGKDPKVAHAIMLLEAVIGLLGGRQ